MGLAPSCVAHGPCTINQSSLIAVCRLISSQARAELKALSQVPSWILGFLTSTKSTSNSTPHILRTYYAHNNINSGQSKIRTTIRVDRHLQLPCSSSKQLFLPSHPRPTEPPIHLPLRPPLAPHGRRAPKDAIQIVLLLDAQHPAVARAVEDVLPVWLIHVGLVQVGRGRDAAAASSAGSSTLVTAACAARLAVELARS